MSWNFCPWCGHRIYQHTDAGCMHLDHPYKPCTDDDCPDHNPSSHPHGHIVNEKCDCTKPHELLTGAQP